MQLCDNCFISSLVNKSISLTAHKDLYISPITLLILNNIIKLLLPEHLSYAVIPNEASLSFTSYIAFAVCITLNGTLPFEETGTCAFRAISIACLR